MEAAGVRHIIHGSRRDTFTIWNLADLHMMSKACAMKRLYADVRRIKNDPRSFFVGGGDYVEAIGFSDKRFRPDSVAEDVSVADLGNLGQAGMERTRDLLMPIKDKCLGLLLGNHELRLQVKNQQEDLHAWLCTELGMPNLRYSALFDVVFSRVPGTRTPRLVPDIPEHRNDSKQYRIFCHHGAGYAQTPGGKLNRLVDFMNNFDADLFMVAHVHDKIARPIIQIGANRFCTELVERRKVGIITGSYLRTYAQGVTTYGEQHGYRPVPLGMSGIRVCPDKGTAVPVEESL